jgi:hypothetical protein
MPNATIYIRKENEDAWSELENKSLWINQQLFKSHTDAPLHIDYTAREPTTETTPKLDNFGFCKNGHPIPEGRIKCLGKGCKYS